MSAVPRFFLYGYYGFDNVGDDLLLKGLVSRLLKISPNAQIVVRSLNSVAGYSKEQVVFLGFEKIMSQIGTSRIIRIWQYALSTWRALRGCSHLVFGGGTLFHAHKGSSINLALVSMMMLMAKLRGMRIYVLGVGVSDIKGRMPRVLMEFILFLADDFVVRDLSSHNNCSRFRFISKLRKATDLVFNLSLDKRHKRDLPTKKVLGLTLSASDLIQDQNAHTEFFISLSKVLVALQAENWDVQFLSFQELDLATVQLSDSEMFKNISKHIPNFQEKLVRVSSDIEKLEEQFSQMDLIVGMRFHGHVLASMLDIPFVGFGRDHKVSDLCEIFSMPFISMNDINEHNLSKAINYARNKKLNASKLSELIKTSEMNFDHIKVL